MKKKSLLVIGLIVVAGIASGLYFGTPKKASVVQPLEQESPMAVDGNQNIVLDNTSEQIQAARNKEQESAQEKANGTGETAPIVTPEDLAYEQQLAEENGRVVADVTITMYAAKDCHVYGKPSEESDVLADLKRGDQVSVSKLDDWCTLVLDDGKEGYVKREWLTDTMPKAGEESASTKNETPGESASKNQEDSGGNNGGSQSQPAPAQKQPTSGESASTQPAPAPEPTPQPQPAPEQSQASSGGISDAERDAMLQLLDSAGALSGDVTGEVTQDDFTSFENTIDVSGVTVH